MPFPVVKKVRSGENSTVFEIASGDQRWFLKIGRRLAPECARLRWLQGRLATNLAVSAKRLSPDKIVEMLAAGLQVFHSANTSGCPFKSYMPGESL